MTDFTEPHGRQYKILAMQDHITEWKELGSHDNPTDAEEHAQKLAEKNPDTEIEIVRVKQFNY